MSLLCIYDKNDYDGKSSAAIVKLANPNCDLLGWRYGEHIDWEYIEGFEIVVMCDVSFDYDSMVRIAKHHFVWIDHHTEIINKLKHLDIPGLQDDKVAACIQTWQWFNPHTEIPRAIELLGKWDVWDHEDPRVGVFQAGMLSMNLHPAHSIWPALFNDDDLDTFKMVMEKGITVQDVYRGINAKAMENAFEFEFHGLKCIGVNNQIGGSMQFKSVGGDDYDAQFVFRYAPEGIVCSVYTVKPNVDIGKICASYGGGGRQGCGGFIINAIPFNMGDVTWLKNL